MSSGTVSTSASQSAAAASQEFNRPSAADEAKAPAAVSMFIPNVPISFPANPQPQRAISSPEQLQALANQILMNSPAARVLMPRAIGLDQHTPPAPKPALTPQEQAEQAQVAEALLLWHSQSPAAALPSPRTRAQAQRSPVVSPSLPLPLPAHPRPYSAHARAREASTNTRSTDPRLSAVILDTAMAAQTRMHAQQAAIHAAKALLASPFRYLPQVTPITQATPIAQLNPLSTATTSTSDANDTGSGSGSGSGKHALQTQTQQTPQTQPSEASEASGTAARAAEIRAQIETEVRREQEQQTQTPMQTQPQSQAQSTAAETQTQSQQQPHSQAHSQQPQAQMPLAPLSLLSHLPLAVSLNPSGASSAPVSFSISALAAAPPTATPQAFSAALTDLDTVPVSVPASPVPVSVSSTAAHTASTSASVSTAASATASVSMSMSMSMSMNIDDMPDAAPPEPEPEPRPQPQPQPQTQQQQQPPQHQRSPPRARAKTTALKTVTVTPARPTVALTRPDPAAAPALGLPSLPSLRPSFAQAHAQPHGLGLPPAHATAISAVAAHVPPHGQLLAQARALVYAPHIQRPVIQPSLFPTLPLPHTLPHLPTHMQPSLPSIKTLTQAQAQQQQQAKQQSQSQAERKSRKRPRDKADNDKDEDEDDEEDLWNVDSAEEQEIQQQLQRKGVHVSPQARAPARVMQAMPPMKQQKQQQQQQQPPHSQPHSQTRTPKKQSRHGKPQPSRKNVFVDPRNGRKRIGVLYEPDDVPRMTLEREIEALVKQTEAAVKQKLRGNPYEQPEMLVASRVSAKERQAKARQVIKEKQETLKEQLTGEKKPSQVKTEGQAQSQSQSHVPSAAAAMLPVPARPQQQQQPRTPGRPVLPVSASAPVSVSVSAASAAAAVPVHAAGPKPLMIPESDEQSDIESPVTPGSTSSEHFPFFGYPPASTAGVHGVHLPLSLLPSTYPSLGPGPAHLRANRGLGQTAPALFSLPPFTHPHDALTQSPSQMSILAAKLLEIQQAEAEPDVEMADAEPSQPSLQLPEPTLPLPSLPSLPLIPAMHSTPGRRFMDYGSSSMEHDQQDGRASSLAFALSPPFSVSIGAHAHGTSPAKHSSGGSGRTSRGTQRGSGHRLSARLFEDDSDNEDEVMRAHTQDQSAAQSVGSLSSLSSLNVNNNGSSAAAAAVASAATFALAGSTQ